MINLKWTGHEAGMKNIINEYILAEKNSWKEGKRQIKVEQY
jgi:hypothetical protein